MEPLKCNICNSIISGMIIKPCRCELYYHKKCIKIQKLNVSDNICNLCNTNITFSIINPCINYIIYYFEIYNNWFFLINSILYIFFAIISVIENGLQDFLPTYTFYNILYLIILSTIIQINNIIFPYECLINPNPIYLLLITFFLFFIYKILYNFITEILIISTSHILMIKIKTYIYIYSSKQPYLQISNYSESELL